MKSSPGIGKNAICMLGIMLAVSIIGAQDTKLIPSPKLRGDFERAIRIIEAHPSPYRKISESALNALIDSTERLLDQPMDVISFYKLLSPIYAAIHDGHTSIRLARHWLISYYKRNGVFPYTVHLGNDNSLYLLQHHGTDRTIPSGARVLALNHLPVDSFLHRIDKYISYELVTFRNSIIQEDFDTYLLLAFGESTEVLITYETDLTDTQLVKFISYEGWKKNKDEEKARIEALIENGKPYEYELVTQGVGLIKIHSFALYSTRDSDLFLDQMFRKIKKDQVHSLIIDLRGNTGGAVFGISDLMHRITTKPFKVTALSEMKVSESFRAYFREIYSGYNLTRLLPIKGRYAFSIGELFDKEIGDYIIEEDSYKEPPQNVYYRFTGDTYLLVDGRTFSAASSFAAAFRCAQLGLIIGTPTGGTRVFHANNMYENLPSTELFCTMATTRIYTPCYAGEDDTVIPDVIVEPTILQLISGRDAAVDYCVHLIRKVNKSQNRE